MTKKAPPRARRGIALIVGAVVSFASQGQRFAYAFADWESGDQSAEATGVFRWSGSVAKSLDDASLVALPWTETHTFFLRGIGEASINSAVRVEVHLLEVVQGRWSGHQAQDTDLSSSSGGLNGSALGSSSLADQTSADQNRTSRLRWIQTDGTYSSGELEVDRMALHVSLPPFDFTVGRQPINLATSNFFTPNDFFAPFSAQAFYRLYKPGVDAARVDVQLGDFAGITIVGVLGYGSATAESATEASASTSGDNHPKLGESSWMAQGRSTVGDVEVSVLAGQLRGASILGGGVQGELWGWLGVRGEGHTTLEDGVFEGAVGVEHRFENTLFLRGEVFYHGAGASSAQGYGSRLLQTGESSSLYLGRLYAALGIGYELTPLLTGDLVCLSNLRDSSGLLAGYLVYSLLEDVELTLTVTLPLGETTPRPVLSSEDLARLASANATATDPTSAEASYASASADAQAEASANASVIANQLLALTPIKSEFGLYPFSAALELRLFF